MSERLGTLLVRARRLKPEQLEEALKRQTEKGGRLGTNLVEIGALDLDLLGAALASQRQVPSASALEFETTPPAVLSLLPAALAAKFVAFPLRVGQGAIVLAMATPWDTDAVRALGDAMHRTVVAKIAPELRILEYLEKRYRLPRPRRMPAPGSPAPEAEAAGPFGQLAQGEFLSSEAEDPFVAAGGSIATSPPLAPRPAAPAPLATRAPAARPPAQAIPRTPSARPLPGLQPSRATPIPFAPPTAQPASPIPPAPAPALPPLQLEPVPIPAGVSLDPFGDSPVAPAIAPTPFADPTAPAIAASPPLDSFLAPAASQPQEEAALLDGASWPRILWSIVAPLSTTLSATSGDSLGSW